MATTVLKVDLDSDVRRFRLAIPEDADNAAKWKLVVEEIRVGFKLEGDAELVMKYRDEEGDQCTLVEDTLPDFLAGASGKPLRVTANLQSKASAASETPAADTQKTPEQMDPTKMFEMFCTVKKMIKMAKGKGKGMCGWKRHWMEAGCPEDWKECKRRWWEEQAMNHEHPLALSEAKARWHCDACWKGCDDGSMLRYRCTAGCDFDLCDDCMTKKVLHDTGKDPKQREDAKDTQEEAAASNDAAGSTAGDNQWQQWMQWRMMMRALKGKGKGKWGKGKGLGKCGKGLGKGLGQCGKGMLWGAPDGGEGLAAPEDPGRHHWDHHSWHHHWAPHEWAGGHAAHHWAAMQQAMSQANDNQQQQQQQQQQQGAPTDPLAFWAATPWGQMVNHVATHIQQMQQQAQQAQQPQPSAPPAEPSKDANMAPEEGK